MAPMADFGGRPPRYRRAIFTTMLNVVDTIESRNWVTNIGLQRGPVVEQVGLGIHEAMMSLGVGRTKDEVICILARQLTKVAAMANVLSHRFAPLLMLCIMRMVAVLILRSCVASLQIWLKSWLSACWWGKSVDFQPSWIFALFWFPPCLSLINIFVWFFLII